jgi:hypothetical protein
MPINAIACLFVVLGGKEGAMAQTIADCTRWALATLLPFIILFLSHLPVYSQSASAMSPNVGTIGTRFTITGSDLGTKKGKVLIGGTAAKIVKRTWTPDSITGEIKEPLPPGVTYDVELRLKGPRPDAPITMQGVFTMMAPEIKDVDPSGIPEEEKTLSGIYFGTKKGKVYIEDPGGGKEIECKVKEWSMYDPVTGDSRIRFIVPKLPKGLLPGPYTLKVTNKVGSDSTTFAVLTYTISATAGANGTISPSGGVVVNYASDQTFAITPNTGYRIADVLVDGSSVGSVSSYTFTNVTANHTISATFAVEEILVKDDFPGFSEDPDWDDHWTMGIGRIVYDDSEPGFVRLLLDGPGTGGTYHNAEKKHYAEAGGFLHSDLDIRCRNSNNNGWDAPGATGSPDSTYGLGSRGWGFWSDQLSLLDASVIWFTSISPESDSQFRGTRVWIICDGSVVLMQDLDIDLTQWHTYRIQWRTDYIGIFVDDMDSPIAEVTDPNNIPNTRLTFTVWVDNYGFLGTLANPVVTYLSVPDIDQYIDVDYVKIYIP